MVALTRDATDHEKRTQ